METLVRVAIMLGLYKSANGILWDQVRCSSDTEQSVPEGRVPEMGRFSWIGIVQHSFYLGGKTRFAITTGVLIHPAYAIAPAEDIAKIHLESLANNTKFIVWETKTKKYTMDVQDYYLHPEYEEQVTFASLALLMLGTEGSIGSNFIAPVMPICLPVKGSGAFDDLFAVKMADDAGEVYKEMLKVNMIENKDCEEFYYRAKLNIKKMSPVNPICVVSERQQQSCVWDGGAALVSRQSWGFWRLIGFGVRGPGCGAPARFLSIHDYIVWIDELISQYPYDVTADTHKFILRSLSPIELIMYKADVQLPRDMGLCDRQARGNVIYKDSSEIALNKNFGQGFFFLSIAQVGKVNCVTIILDVSSRTNLAVWLENQCHKELTGDRRGYHKRRKLIKDIRPVGKALERSWISFRLQSVSDISGDSMECFLYFKTVAFLEFRFYFSFKALLEVTVYGELEESRIIPNPWKRTETTVSWWPTDRWIRWGSFLPYYVWMYDL